MQTNPAVKQSNR